MGTDSLSGRIGERSPPVRGGDGPPIDDLNLARIRNELQ
jgi:hypothetical protein